MLISLPKIGDLLLIILLVRFLKFFGRFIISSSYTGKDGIEYIKGTSTMDGNPHSFITGVQLYNKSGIAVAVASLSKPLLKNFTKEGVIKVRLDL